MRVVTLGSASLCGVGVLVVAWALLGGGEPATLTLPFGPPGTATHLMLDPLSAWFLLLLFVAAAACAVFADAERTSPRQSLAALPAMLGAMTITVLAADAFTLVLGLGLLGLSRWAVLSPDQKTDGAVRCVRTAMLGVVCLIAAFAVAGFADFSAIRAAPPAGWRADIVFILALLGAGMAIALSSHQAGLHRGVSAIPGHMVALAGGAGMTIGMYLPVRVVLDLCGLAQQVWWSVPLLLVGATLSVLGALCATLASELDAALSLGSLQQIGLAIIGLGVALIARTVDLPTLTELAISATLLQVTTLVVCRTLLLLCATAAQDGAGTRRLDRLGGLIHRMPVTALCTLTGMFGVVALPAGLGFAGSWLLFQSLLAAARVGGFSLQVLIAATAGLIALSMGLALVATVRLFGVACLGRPRTPRTAAAEEVAMPRRVSLISLAVLVGLLGLLPGLALLPAQPALAMLAHAVPNRGGLVLLTLGSDQPGYAALSIATLLAIAGCAALVWLRRRGTAEHRQEPAWSGGFAAPPAWLPFGDPATQFSAASFAEPVRHGLGAALRLRDPVASWLCATRRRSRDTWSNAVKAAACFGTSSTVAGMLAVLILVLAIWLVAS